MQPAIEVTASDGTKRKANLSEKQMEEFRGDANATTLLIGATPIRALRLRCAKHNRLPLVRECNAGLACFGESC